ncbi:hypothetical protein [Streptomyces peucetius]|uniref:Serine/threonine protein kinase n=1 Tax=Streptomyces peucetius TaxID=1950 RepID=A0ABY6I7U3_STRPE|nr:hypothetical protein [Streptomyces peucetius]UYQ62993.1 hypothetical protein OGH68_16865 [Streptomyces peucetius]
MDTHADNVPADPAPDTPPAAPIPVPVPVDEPEPAAAAVPAGPVRTRRRGRTTLLIAAAAVLGAVAGTVTGYAVQYHREPTPLPALSQPDIRTPKPVQANRNTTARSMSVNRWVKTDGDLRQLLLPKPKGAKHEQKPDWEDLYSFATWFEYEGEMFQDLAMNDFRRSATVSWSKGGKVYVDIRLVQFREAVQINAESFGEGQQSYLGEDDWAGNEGEPIPGSANGRTYIFDEPHREPGYEPLYEGMAVAWRGDIVMLITYRNNSGPIDEKDLKSLAKRQLERL